MSKKIKNTKNGAKETAPRRKGNQASIDLAALLQQHRQIWCNEWRRLKDQEESVKNDVVDKLRYLSCQSLDDVVGQCLETWIDLELEATKFQDNASSRIQLFKRLVQRCFDEGITEQLKEDVDAASLELRQLTETLAQDRLEAERQVTQAFDIPMLTSVRFTFARNVDEEFLAAHKEDSKIRRSQLGELRQLDQDFEKKLREIDKTHKTEEEPADWTTDDYQVVQHVLEQYPKSLPNRRALVMDMLKRRFPHRSVLDVSTYMVWCQNQVFYRSKVNSTVQDWERARIQWLREAGKAMKDEQMEQKARRQSMNRNKSVSGATRAPRQRTKSEPPPARRKKETGRRKGGSLKKVKVASGDTKGKSIGDRATKASKKARSRSTSRPPNKTAKEKSDLSKDQTRRFALKEANLSVSRSTRGVCPLDTSFSALLNDASKSLARQRDKGPRVCTVKKTPAPRLPKGKKAKAALTARYKETFANAVFSAMDTHKHNDPNFSIEEVVDELMKQNEPEKQNENEKEISQKKKPKPPIDYHRRPVRRRRIRLLTFTNEPPKWKV